ncbi:MAG TPA: helix-turn-helix transcriptional regulator [Verrucomicrobiae bacterium]|nr:helix-turn-helix transcriptional regulator [Verrucomicrobiae bacterium]
MNEIVVMPLSPTEQKVLALYDQGKSYKEISSELDISVHTVKTHAERILAKTLANCLRHAAYVRGGSRIKAC